MHANEALVPKPTPFELEIIFENLKRYKSLGTYNRRVQIGSGSHPASYKMGKRGSFPGSKAARV
jgi:hypothetical protein